MTSERDGDAAARLAWWAPHALTGAVGAHPASVQRALVEVEDGHVVRVTGGVDPDAAAASPDLPHLERFDDGVIAPGFVNAHAHLEYAAYDGITDALEFADWILDHIQRKRRLSPDQMRASAELGAWQAVAGGITTVGDASFSGDAVHAMHAVGLRGRAYLELFGGTIGTPTEAVATETARGIVDAAMARLAELPSSDLLELGLSPHAPYTVAADTYAAVAATGLPWMTHLAESPAERDAVLHGRGPIADRLSGAFGAPGPRWHRSPTLELAAAGLLGPHVVGVHLVQADGEELEALAAAGVGVAHCPRSNARLGCGVLDLSRLDRAGIVVGLGTDSPASAGAIDMFAEMRSGLELHRAIGRDATAPTPRRMLELATTGAARVLGLPTAGRGAVGVVAEGAVADLQVVRTGATRDPLQALVLRATPADVQVAVVAGRTVWRENRPQLAAARTRAQSARTLLELPTGGSPIAARPGTGATPVGATGPAATAGHA